MGFGANTISSGLSRIFLIVGLLMCIKPDNREVCLVSIHRRLGPARRKMRIMRMPTQSIIVVFLALVVAFSHGETRAQRDERSGKQVVEAVCFSCHGSGANGAPKIGDRKAWNKRAS